YSEGRETTIANLRSWHKLLGPHVRGRQENWLERWGSCRVVSAEILDQRTCQLRPDSCAGATAPELPRTRTSVSRRAMNPQLTRNQNSNLSANLFTILSKPTELLTPAVRNYPIQNHIVTRIPLPKGM